MNRYNFSRAEIKRAILWNSGDANDTPNFMKKYAFEVKGDKLFFEGREVIPNEDRNAYLRKILYDKESDLPLARDSLFYLLKKQVINISKRYIQTFLKKQNVIVKRTAKPRKEIRKFVNCPFRNAVIRQGTECRQGASSYSDLAGFPVRVCVRLCGPLRRSAPSVWTDLVVKFTGPECAHYTQKCTPLF